MAVDHELVDELKQVLAAEIKEERGEIQATYTRALNRSRKWMIGLVLLVILGSFLYVKHIEHAQRHYNCEVAEAISVPVAAFFRSDAEVRERQAHLAVGPKLVSEIGLLIHGSDTLKLLGQATQESNKISEEAARYWQTTLVHQVEEVRTHNCR